jgi:hypothetical protein
MTAATNELDIEIEKQRPVGLSRASAVAHRVRLVANPSAVQIGGLGWHAGGRNHFIGP